MKIAIAGAGIGGLTAALSLHAPASTSRSSRPASELRPLGVGINLLPHAVRVLSELGLQPALAAARASRRASWSTSTASARRSGASRAAATPAMPWPQFSIHRGELQMILLDAARARLGADRMQLRPRIAGFEQKGGTVTARFADRDGVIVETSRADVADRRRRHPLGGARAASIPTKARRSWNGRCCGAASPRPSRSSAARTMVHGRPPRPEVRLLSDHPRRRRAGRGR